VAISFITWAGMQMKEHHCRACRGQAGNIVLDLGDQPACDYFPR
jgi:hypothetical protein